MIGSMVMAARHSPPPHVGSEELSGADELAGVELDGAEMVGTEIDSMELDGAEVAETTLLEAGTALAVEVTRVELGGRPHPRLAAAVVTRAAKTPTPKNFILAN